MGSTGSQGVILSGVHHPYLELAVGINLCHCRVCPQSGKVLIRILSNHMPGILGNDHGKYYSQLVSEQVSVLEIKGFRD